MERHETGKTLFRGVLAAIILTGAVSALAAEGHDHDTLRGDHWFSLEMNAPFERSLTFTTHGPDDPASGQSSATYLVRDCGLASSETGAFAFLDDRNADPTVVLLCETFSSRRSLYVFRPSDNATAPIFSITGKPSLSVSVFAGGFVAGWQSDEDEYETVVWEPDFSSAGSERFRNARDAAVGMRTGSAFSPPPEVSPGDYRIAAHADVPLRLGPHQDAPWFRRLQDHVLIHLADDEIEAPKGAFWQAGKWLRVCIPDGGCGYVEARDLARLP